MKYYGILRKKRHERILYNTAKLQCFCSQYTSLDKTTRERRRNLYASKFVSPYRFKDRYNAIPDGKYYIPVCVITSDLVLREDIPRLKAGLANLLKNHYSHKFMGAYHSIDEILNKVENMDDTLTSWFSSIRVGRFDFEGTSVLQNHISWFDVFAKNINSSYLSLEFHLYFTDAYTKEQTQIINGDYSYATGHISSSFNRNKKISGGKRSYGIRYYDDAALKSDLLYENLVALKWDFYTKIQKFCPTILHQKNICPPSINIYKTNIHYSEKGLESFWTSVGISEFYGQFLDEARKIFFKTTLSGRYERDFCNDLIYVVNSETLERQSMYYSLDYQIIDSFSSSLSSELFAFMFLKALNQTVATTLIQHKSKLNKIKLKRNKLSQLLKLRYSFEKDLDFYKRYTCDEIWADAKKQIVRSLKDKAKLSYGHSILTGSPLAAKTKINTQMNALRMEFDNKTTILQHLATYKRERRGDIINLIMLLLTTLTLLFVIFPELSVSAANCLLQIFSFLSNTLERIFNYFVS